MTDIISIQLMEPNLLITNGFYVMFTWDVDTNLEFNLHDRMNHGIARCWLSRKSGLFFT